MWLIFFLNININIDDFKVVYRVLQPSGSGFIHVLYR